VKMVIIGRGGPPSPLVVAFQNQQEH
jgi:hypothetical protein